MTYLLCFILALQGDPVEQNLLFNATLELNKDLDEMSFEPEGKGSNVDVDDTETVLRVYNACRDVSERDFSAFIRGARRERGCFQIKGWGDSLLDDGLNGRGDRALDHAEQKAPCPS